MDIDFELGSGTGSSDKFNCFSSTETAFNAENNCLWFTIIFIYSIIATVILIVMVVTVCYCGSQNKKLKKSKKIHRRFSVSSSHTNIWNQHGLPRLQLQDDPYGHVNQGFTEPPQNLTVPVKNDVDVELEKLKKLLKDNPGLLNK